MLRLRQICLTALAVLLLAALLCPAALGADSEQAISGAVRASALQSNAVIVLTGDTVLTLDGNRTVQRLVCAPSAAPTLTVRGSGTLTVAAGAQLDALVLESGTLKITAGSGSPDSGLKARTAEIRGGVLDARDANDSYGVEITDCMTVTGGTVTGTGRFSGVYAAQLLVSGGSVTGTGTGRGGEFDSCDGVFTEVLKVSGGSVSGSGSEAGVTAERRVALTEGVRVTTPAGGAVSQQPVRIPAWGNDQHPYYTYTVLDSRGAIAQSAALGLPPTAFRDVPSGQYYAVPVAWAAAQGVTTGTSETTFSPDATCTRGQVVTFLWRAAGSPTPRSAANAFTDVKPSDYYYNAVLWAVENGITNGTDASHFSPNATCTRGHVVTFLHRFEHSPAVAGANPFTDVKTADYFYSPVLWAVSRGVTNGMSATTFSPGAACTRGQVVTFLYRDLHRTPTPDVLTD